jgi:glutaredoxin
VESKIKSVVQTLLLAVIGSVVGVLCVVGARQLLKENESQVSPQRGDYSSIVSSIKPGNKLPILVTKKGCPACKAANEWLAQQEIDVHLIVSDDELELSDRLMMETQTSAVPLLITKKEIVVGFDKNVWEDVNFK